MLPHPSLLSPCSDHSASTMKSLLFPLTALLYLHSVVATLLSDEWLAYRRDALAAEPRAFASGKNRNGKSITQISTANVIGKDGEDGGVSLQPEIPLMIGTMTFRLCTTSEKLRMAGSLPPSLCHLAIKLQQTRSNATPRLRNVAVLSQSRTRHWESIPNARTKGFQVQDKVMLGIYRYF